MGVPPNYPPQDHPEPPYPGQPQVSPTAGDWTTSDERTMATLAHALQIIGWLGWLPALIIFLVKKESRFVRFHALQALLFQVAVVIIWMVVMIAWVVVIFSMVFRSAQGSHPAQPPTAFFIAAPIIWGAFFVTWALVLVFAIVYAIKAGRGEWANYPIFGNMARRILKM
jgi:uncharacterized membrane protein